MKIKFLLLATITVFALSACNRSPKQHISPDAGSKGHLVVTYKTSLGEGLVERTNWGIEIVSAVLENSIVTISRDGQRFYGDHKICLADYSLADIGDNYPDNKELTAICFLLNGEEGSTGKSLITPGVYRPQSAAIPNYIPQFNCLSSIGINPHKGKKRSFTESLDPNRTVGTLTIDSATSEDIVGEIDLRDDYESITGSFTAHLPPPPTPKTPANKKPL